jgi:hypothetical protein
MILTEEASFLGFPVVWFSIQAFRPDEHCSIPYTDTALLRAFVYIRTIPPRPEDRPAYYSKSEYMASHLTRQQHSKLIFIFVQAFLYV